LLSYFEITGVSDYKKGEENMNDFKKYSGALALELDKLKAGVDAPTEKWLEDTFGPKSITNQIQVMENERKKRDKEVKIKRKRKLAFNREMERRRTSKVWRFLYKIQTKFFSSYLVYRQKTTLDF